MSLRINTNIAAMDAYRNLSNTSDAMTSSLQKLSSGYRINKAADDASGLAISQGLQAQITGLQQATSNAQDAISVVQTAEGALGESESILQRMNQLAVQAANGGSQDTNAQADAQTEVKQLQSELDRIANTTKFGQQVLLNGSFSGVFQVGADNATNEQITVAITNGSGGSLNAAGLGVGSSQVNVSSVASAQASITAIQNAIQQVSTVRANLGAYQNRFQHTINNLNTTVENLSSANSQIVNVDMAAEMVNFTRDQILQQAGTAMLSQANKMPQSVLQLLQGM